MSETTSEKGCPVCGSPFNPWGDCQRCADRVIRHLGRVHGMEMIDCPACHGQGCARCRFEGIALRVGQTGPCESPDCPIRRVEAKRK